MKKPPTKNKTEKNKKDETEKNKKDEPHTKKSRTDPKNVDTNEPRNPSIFSRIFFPPIFKSSKSIVKMNNDNDNDDNDDDDDKMNNDDDNGDDDDDDKMNNGDDDDNGVGSVPVISANTVTNLLEVNIEKIKNKCENGEVATKDTCSLNVTLNVTELILFAIIQTILEIYDADHDLNRSKYDKNPLVEYCRSFYGKYPKFVFINNNIIELNNDNLEDIYKDVRWNSTSQSAIKKNMENILKGLDPIFLSKFGRIPYTSSMTEEPKSLINLQHSLKTKDIDLTIVETHRGGLPNNTSVNINNTRDVSIMLKGTASTRFDLGSMGFPLIKNNDVETVFCSLPHKPNTDGYNYTNRQDPITGPKSPLCRFFSNYFPNSFTIVIKKSELNSVKLTEIFRQMGDYFSNFRNTNEGVAKMLEEQINQKKKETGFFRGSSDDETYLLHMFMDINKDDKGEPTFKPTFSIQKGQITADQVTEALYGVKHRCLSSKKATTPIEDSLLILDDKITAFVKFCHILYGKTIGDGMAIEIVKILAKIFGITVNLLSNDVCCTYRNVFVNGFSTRQAPSSLAGTGLGSLTNYRNVEILSMIKPTTTTLSQCIEVIINKGNDDYHPTEPTTFINSLEIDGIDKNALDDILTCAYRKIYNDEYNSITIEKQNDIITLIKKLKEAENLTIEETDCELLKELCLNPQLLFIKTKVDNSFENFKNRLRNILKKIQVDYPELIKTRVSGDVQIASTVERGISLVSSMEQLLGEVYPCNNDVLGLKKIVLYFLTVVIQQSISATRIIGRYIEMLKESLIQTIEVQTGDIKGLNSNSSYEDLLAVFNVVFGGFRPDYQNDDIELTRYKNRQLAKQPLNLLKFILRSFEAINQWENSINGIKEFLTYETSGKLYENPAYSNLYQYINSNYKEIIEGSHAASAIQSLEVINTFTDFSQGILSQNSQNLLSEINSQNLLSEIITEEKKNEITEDEINKEAKDNLPYSISNMLANLEDAEKIKAMILKHTEISSQEEYEDKKILLNKLAKPDLYIIGSKTGESPESMNPFIQQPPVPISPQRNVTDFLFITPSPKKPARTDNDFVESQNQEDDLNTALAAAIGGDIYTHDQNEIGEDEKDDEPEEANTKMEAGFYGKPSRKTKNKRNKITRNKKSKNNQTKKHKRTKRRKVI